MEVQSGRSECIRDVIRDVSSDINQDSIDDPSSSSIDYDFDVSQCLFCNQTNTDLDHNLAHMSTTHGLHIASTDLLIELESLLAYFHLLIFSYYEFLYCGTERNTRQAVQQHMIAKGHCKYDITDKDSEFREFYEYSSSESEEEIHQKLSAMRFSDDPHLSSPPRSRRSRPKRLNKQVPVITASPLNPAVPAPIPQVHIDTESSSNTTGTPSPTTGEVSIRAQKQESTLNNHLAQLRADDRRSLLHLPTYQQRAILATRHKQMEKARRTEQTNRGNLEGAGNHFSRLGTTRLVRQPPHFGNVSGLNR